MMKGKYIKIGIIALIAVIIGTAILKDSIDSAKEKKYHESMSVLSDPQSVPVEGSKMVTLADGKFSRLYIPEDWQAESPEEVRYILYCSDTDTAVGTYTNGGTGYRVDRKISVYDRKTGAYCAEELFIGNDPPSTVEEKGDHYGRLADEEDVTKWLERVIQKLEQ